MKEIYKVHVDYGLYGIFITVFSLFVTIFYLYNMYRLVMLTNLQLDLDGALILLVGFIAIGAILYIKQGIIIRTIRKFLRQPVYDVIVYDKGVRIGKTFYKWNRIMSISFHTGRHKHKAFHKQCGLPAKQRLFLLDKRGDEHSAIIDIDYPWKRDREKNHLRILQMVFSDLGKVNLISDWAQ